MSAAAVSFAVNDRPGVGSATRVRILAAAAELGWRPSHTARALSEARSRAIGLVLFRDPAQLESDAFFVRFLAGIERTLAAADHALLLQLLPPGGAGSALAAYERLAAAGRVDGVLLCDVEVDDPRFAPLAAAGMPMVAAGRPVGHVPVPWVESDHARGMAEAVTHLAGLGHERIGFLGASPAFEHVQARRASWARALADAGLPCGPAVCAGGPADIGSAAQAVLAAGPTAVACTSDQLAMALMAAARAGAIEVPAGLSVTGFDDSSLAAFAQPPLTSVHVDYAEFGAAAAAALLDVTAGAPPGRYEPAPAVLTVRGSTAPPAG